MAEKYFFKCPIKTVLHKCPIKTQPLKPRKYHEYLYTQTLKTAWVGPEPVES